MFALPGSVGQREHSELSAERSVVAQAGIAAHRTQTSGRVGQAGCEADAGPAANTRENADVLFAAVLVGVDVADDARRGLELVEFLARLGIDRLEIAFERSVEHDAAGGRERSGPYRELLRHRPDDLAGPRVPGDEVAHVGLAGRRIHGQRRPDIGLAGRVAHPERLVVHANVVRRHVEQAGLRREGSGLLVLRAERRRADALRVDVLALLVGRVLVNHLRTAIGRRGLVHVDAGRPVDGRIVLLGHEQLAVGAVERVGQPVAVEVDQDLPVLAADLLVGEDHLVDAVIVPLVVGRHLVDPSGHAGVDVTREDGHRPAIVAGSLLRVPGRGIAGSDVKQVQLGIVGIPAPRRAATDLPLLSLPGVGAGIRADRLAEMRGLLRVDQRVAVRAHRIPAPHALAGLHVVSRHRPAHAELAARDADDHLVLEDHRGRRAGLALGRIAVLLRPHDVAGLGIERDERRVGLVQEDLSVRIGGTAVHGVAAHHRNDIGILLGLVFPKDLAIGIQVQRVDDVGERSMDVHHVSDHQRSAFVPAQDAGRKCPCHL